MFVIRTWRFAISTDDIGNKQEVSFSFAFLWIASRAFYLSERRHRNEQPCGLWLELPLTVKPQEVFSSLVVPYRLLLQFQRGKIPFLPRVMVEKHEIVFMTGWHVCLSSLPSARNVQNEHGRLWKSNLCAGEVIKRLLIPSTWASNCH